jgi:hypothetical protein
MREASRIAEQQEKEDNENKVEEGDKKEEETK